MGINIKAHLKKRMICIGFIWLTIRPVAGCCQHGGDESATIKCGEFPDHLIVYEAVWNDFHLVTFWYYGSYT
jgi:hypothetical protein